MTDYARRIVKGGMQTFILTLSGAAVAYVFRLLLSRTLSVSDFGLFYAILAFIGFFSLFRDFGLTTAIAKRIPEFAVGHAYQRIKGLIVLGLATEFLASAAIAAVIFFFSNEIASSYFKSADAVLPLHILLGSFVFGSIFLIFQSSLQGLGKVLSFASLETVRMTVILVSFVLLLNLGIAGAAASYLIASIGVALLSFAFLVPALRQFRGLEISKPLALSLFRFAIPVFFSGLSGVIFNYTDTLVITYFLSAVEVGLYQVAIPTASMLWVFVNSLGGILLPTVSEMHAKGQKELLGRAVAVLTRAFLAVIVPFAALMLAFPEFVIGLLFGPAYLGSTAVLQILSIGAIFGSLWGVYGSIILGIDKPAKHTKITFALAVLDAAGNAMLVPLIGIQGAAVTTLLSFVIGVVLARRIIKASVPFKFPVLSAIKIFVSGLIFWAAITGLKGVLVLDPWPEVLVSLVAGFSIYSLLVLKLGAVTRDDVSQLESLDLPIPKFAIKAAKRIAS